MANRYASFSVQELSLFAVSSPCYDSEDKANMSTAEVNNSERNPTARLFCDEPGTVPPRSGARLQTCRVAIPGTCSATAAARLIDPADPRSTEPLNPGYETIEPSTVRKHARNRFQFDMAVLMTNSNGHALKDTTAIGGVFMIHDPLWREKIFFGGLLLLLAPPIGWPAALGYRKALVERLLSGQSPVLPDWKGQVWRHFTEGLKAIGVIFAYYTPLYILLGIVIDAKGGTPNEYWLYTLFFFLLAPLFSPLAFPLIVISSGLFGQPIPLGIPATATLLLLFTLATFVIPAGFLQVSLTASYGSALRLFEALSLIRRNFRLYLRAWYHSIVMSLSGHFAIPFSPWGIVWCYLGIIFLFNSILVEGEEDITPDCTWFGKLASDPRIKIRRTEKKSIVRVLNTSEESSTDEIYAARVDQILIPLPLAVSSRLFPRGA